MEGGGILSKEDICEVDATQVVSIKPEYEWDGMSERVLYCL